MEISLEDITFDLQVHEFPFADYLDQPCTFQFLDVMRKCGCCHAMRGKQRGARICAGRGADFLEYLISPWGRQSLSNQLKLSFSYSAPCLAGWFHDSLSIR